MTYVSLKKIYYTEPARHQAAYKERFNSPACRRLPFGIKQFNRSREFPAFFIYTEDIVLELEKLFDRNEALNAAILKTPPIISRQFSLSCIIDEIQSTNEIEGVISSKTELRTALETLSKTPRFSTIINSYNRLISRETIPFETCRDIRAFYEQFTYDDVLSYNPNNRLDGEIFRAGAVDISSASGKTLHRGAYPESAIISSMVTALDILHDGNIPLPVRLAVFHYYFLYIHPFYDGNGRTGRFIVSYFLAQRFHPFVALQLSCVIRKRLTKYYEMFRLANSEINCGDLTPFIESFLSIISSAFDNATETLTRKTLQTEKLQQRLLNGITVDKLSRDLYVILLQTSSFYGYGLTIPELMQLTGKSRNTVQSRLKLMPPEHLTIIEDKPLRYKINPLLFKRLQ